MATSEESLNDASPLRDKLIPDSAGPNISQSDREGSSPLVPEKPSEDGYNWRKYGQKNIKGNDFVRCYYKCSFLNCQVKKQVEHAPDGRIIETTYFGEHDHPKPQTCLPVDVPSPRPAQVKIPDQRPDARDDSLTDDKAPKKAYGALVTQVSADAAATPLSAGAKDDSNRKQNPKRRKKVAESGEPVVDKPCGESRHVVETVSAVDILNDGYRWRKYGQKLVRGNSNPRSYYRCSNPGCPAKKQVERASHDPRIVVTAYEGQHDHDVPPTHMIFPHNTENAVSEQRNGAEPKPQEGTNPQDGLPTLAEPTNAIPKAEEEISSEAMNDAEPETEGRTPQHTNKRSTNEAKTKQEEVDQARNFESIPEQRQEKEMKGKDDSLEDPEITTTKQPVLISKTEELQRPDTGVSC